MIYEYKGHSININLLYNDEYKNIAVIYQIILNNNKVYIGRTKNNILSRIRQHINSESMVGNAIRKHGIYSINILYRDDNYDTEVLDEREIFYISLFKSTDRKSGYNIRKGGGNNEYLCTQNPYLKTEEHKKKIRDSLRNVPKSKEARNSMSEARKNIMNDKFKDRILAVNVQKITLKSVPDNLVFLSIKQCAIYYNVDPNTIRYWLDSDKICPKLQQYFTTKLD